MNEAISLALKNWIPYRLFSQDNESLCRWLLIDDKDFTEPFFDETISRYRGQEYNSLSMKCTSSLNILPEWSEHIESIAPAAFIFHVSRCGSTLASQLLSLSEENIVLSEVPFFDELLRPGYSMPAEYDRFPLLKAAIRFYGAKRKESQRRLFIKTDCWQVLFYRQLRELYPGVPFILLYRHPAEVIRSQQKQRGMQSVPGLIEPELFGFDKEAVLEMHLDEYMAKVLEKFFQSFLDIVQKDPLAVPVNYNEGPVAMIKKIAAATSMPIGQKYMDEIKQRAGYHGKYPGQLFGEEALLADIPAYCARAIHLYEALEQSRVSIPALAQYELT